MLRCLSYPFAAVYLILGWFFPRLCAFTLCAFSILLLLFIISVSSVLKFRDDDFSEEERELLYKFPVYFRFYFFSKDISTFLGVFQMATIPMAIILGIKGFYIYIAPLVLVYAVFSHLRPKLDPLFFEKELLKRQKDMWGRMQVQSDINLLVSVYDKFWRRDKDERARTSSNEDIKMHLEKSEGSISLLMPYYLDDTIIRIFREIGFEIFWADNAKDTEEIIIDNEPDLAIEWQHGSDDFPIRDLLRKHGRKTPVILLLNWNGSMPGDLKNIDCAGFSEPSDIRGIIAQFFKALPHKKKGLLIQMCDSVGIDLGDLGFNILK